MTGERREGPDVVVLGSLHMDLIASAARLPRRGETVHGGLFSMHPGGKAGNQAVAAARQGARTALIARVGGDLFGSELRQRMAAQGIDVSLIQSDDHRSTGASTVFAEDGGEYASIIVPGAGMALTEETLEPARSALARCRVLMLQLEIAPEASRAAAAITHAAGGLVLLNPSPLEVGGSAVDRMFLDNVDVLVTNRREAEMVSGVPSRTPEDARQAAVRIMRERSVGTVVVTLGQEGAVLVAGDSWTYVAGHVRDVVDTVGAGDAFAGAFAAALARDESRERALVLGNAAGALAVSARGAFDAMPALEATVALAGW